MSLPSYARRRWILAHEPSMEEIRGLLALADRDIEQCQTPGLGTEWRFDIAYNSALQSATAALAAAGYRAERANKHMRVIESLEFTLGLEKGQILVLDKLRRKRHVAVYDRVGAVSEREATEMLEMARELRERVESWIGSKYPGLLSPDS